MKITTLIILLSSLVAKANYAEVRPFDKLNEKPIFKIEFSEKKENSKVEVVALFKDEQQLQLEEKATVNDITAEFSLYSVNQLQTKEKGYVEISEDKVKIKYEKQGQAAEYKELKKPDRLVAPANFDRWLRNNFAKLKAEKSIVINFLVWDRLDIYKFKVTYLGEGTFENKKIQRFKMNIDNFLLSALVDPIQIDMNEDATKLVRYQGRVAVKKKQGDQYKNLDAYVTYFN